MTAQDEEPPTGHHGPTTSAGSGEASPLHAALDDVRARYGDVIDDPERLNALHRLGMAEAQPEKVFDDITDLLRLEFDVSVARIHLLDDTQLQIKSASGDIGGGAIPVRPSMCGYTIRQDRILIIPDLNDDPEFAPMNISVGGQPMRFYAGAPLTTRDGHNVGSLCLLDARARDGLQPHEYALLGRMAQLTSHTMELRNAQKQARDYLIQAVDEDPITGLLSRDGVSLRLQRRIQDTEDGGAGISVIELRLGRLDLLETGFGTAARNTILSEIAARLEHEALDGELTARVGDIAFLLVTASDAETRAGLDADIATRARRLITVLSQPIAIADEQFHPEVCAGVARIPPDGSDADEMLHMVHDAAVRAAGMYGDCVGWPDADAVAAERRKLSLEGRIRRAVSRDEFRPHYQPIVALQDNSRVVGAEALLRWPQPEGQSPIGPAMFIPLAEELGLMDRIGMRVFELSCEQLRRWQAEPGNEAFWVSVNLAPQQLQDRNLAERFVATARAAGISPASIKLEVTESAFEEGFDVASQVLDELTAAGFSLALDDFGTGHSSLSRLIGMPFDVLKVDRSFVDQVPNNPGAAVVASLRQLAHSLRMQALAEGVETEAHESYLRELGYELAQGFYYSQPLDPDTFATWRHER